MSRKNFTWIAIIVLIILGLAAWWFLSHENSTAPATQPVQTNQNLFPYGQNATSSQNNSSTTNQSTVFINTPSTNLPTLIHITTTPVSGDIFLPESATSSTTTLRYIDRATGHIYDYSFSAGTSTEITNTTVPVVYQGFFSPTGSRVYLETLDTNSQINTVSAPIPSATTSVPVGLGTFSILPKNIIALTTNSSSLFYLVPTLNGSAGYISALDGTKPSLIFNSGLSELTANWSNAGIGLQTKASASADGYFFNLNPKTGVFIPIIDSTLGLTTLENPSGTFIFGSATANGSLSSFIYNEKQNSSQKITLNTLADKCIWSTTNTNAIYCAIPTSISGTLPDDWYQGNIFLAGDNIWKISADTGITNVVDFLSATNPNIDAENLTLDKNEKWLAFMDKEDLTLWALRVNQ